MEAKKYKRYLIFGIAGLIFSIAAIIYFNAANDKRAAGFYIIAAADIVEIARDAKRCRNAKESDKNNERTDL